MTKTWSPLEEGEVLVKLREQPTVENIQETWTCEDREELMKHSRKFNFDLTLGFCTPESRWWSFLFPPTADSTLSSSLSPDSSPWTAI